MIPGKPHAWFASHTTISGEHCPAGILISFSSSHSFRLCLFSASVSFLTRGLSSLLWLTNTRALGMLLSSLYGDCIPTSRTVVFGSVSLELGNATVRLICGRRPHSATVWLLI